MGETITSKEKRMEQMTKKEHFLETCVFLSGLERDSILKKVLKDAFQYVLQSHSESAQGQNPTPNSPDSSKYIPDELPEGLTLLTFKPSEIDFVDYAFALSTLQDSKEVMVRHILSTQFDTTFHPKDSPVRYKNFQKFGNKVGKEPPLKKKRPNSDFEQSTKIGSEVEAALGFSEPRNLPSKLDLFVKFDGSPMTTISEITSEFFSQVVLIWPGIYRDDSNTLFVLLVADNGRYKNSWKSAGTQNKFTWYTSNDDTDRKVLDMITHDDSVVHIVRKRNSEIMYMGKRRNIENVDRPNGSCVMYVS